MDILTPKGQESLAHERRAKELLEARYGVQYVETPKDKPAVVDALLIRSGAIVGLVETKCRDMTLWQLQNRFNSEWLVTFNKINKGRLMARDLGVSFYGVLYLIPDDRILTVRLSTPSGDWATEVRRERTETQATINGGTARRMNAFVNMKLAKTE